MAGTGEPGQGSQVLKVDPRKKTVTLFDPGSATPPPTVHTEEMRVGIAAPKMFTFDGIYTQEDSQVRFEGMKGRGEEGEEGEEG